MDGLPVSLEAVLVSPSGRQKGQRAAAGCWAWVNLNDILGNRRQVLVMKKPMSSVPKRRAMALPNGRNRAALTARWTRSP
jgi:hypothetical protein